MQHAEQEARRRWRMADQPAAADSVDEATGDRRQVRRTYDQSMSGRSSSQRTAPPDSRSMATTSSAPIRQRAYTALRKYPTVVPQREAKAMRSAGRSDIRYVRSVSISGNVPGGRAKTIPEAHVLTCTARYTRGMSRDTDDEQMRARLYEVRRARLRRLLERYSSIVEFAVAIQESPSYTHRLVKLPNKWRKNLGDGKARKIELLLGLPEFWLDNDSAADPIPTLRAAWPFRFERAIWDNLTGAEQRRAESMLLTIINGIEAERASQKDTG